MRHLAIQDRMQLSTEIIDHPTPVLHVALSICLRLLSFFPIFLGCLFSSYTCCYAAAMFERQTGDVPPCVMVQLYSAIHELLGILKMTQDGCRCSTRKTRGDVVESWTIPLLESFSFCQDVHTSGTPITVSSRDFDMVWRIFGCLAND